MDDLLKDSSKQCTQLNKAT